MERTDIQAEIRERAARVESQPDNPEFWSDLGASYLAEGSVDLALIGFARAVELRPSSAEFHYNLGLGHQENGDLSQALLSYRTALGLDNRHGKAWNNISVVLKAMGKTEAALSAGQQAVSVEPENADFQWTLSLTELLLGNYRQGFERYEWRRRIRGFKQIGGTRWQGETARDRELVVYSEQGLGDTLNFMRFIGAARTRVGKVTLQCPERLVPLLRAGFTGADRIEKSGSVSPEVLTTPLMSLPHLLGMTDRLGMDRPYVRVDSSLRNHWRKRLDSTRLNVGLCWQGNPRHRADRDRSIPLDVLEPLVQNPNCQFLSLQKEDGVDQLVKQPDLPIVDLSEQLDTLHPFLDTAAMLTELDLFITVDTSLAHLAGALGTDVWLLLSYPPDYRWGLGDQPWYPTLTPYRKAPFEDWSAVVARIFNDIRQLDIRKRGRR